MNANVDLNADLGESFGAWSLGDDQAMLDIVSSANIACGFHAGDPDSIYTTVQSALERGVRIGAHPGFPDLQGFGRRAMHIPLDSLTNMIRYQVAAVDGITRALGGEVSHIKLHGALANMAATDELLAKTCYEAALSVNAHLYLMVIAGTKQETAAQAIGQPLMREIFADRTYNDNGILVDRNLKNALIHEAEIAAQRVINMLEAQAIISHNNKYIPTKIDTICVHGDSENARQIAQTVKARLNEIGIQIASPVS